MVKALQAILKRDLALALRAGGGAALGVAFYLIFVTLAPLGIGPEPAALARVAPGLVWVGALLAALLTLERLFQPDVEDGTLDHLALAPAPLEAVVFVKAFAHWLTTGAPFLIVAPLAGLLLRLPAEAAPTLVLSMLAGGPALSFIGAIGAALTSGLRRGGLLTSLLVLPLYIPTLIFGAETARRGAQGLATETPLLLLAGITLGAVAILPFAAAAAIRVNLR